MPVEHLLQHVLAVPAGAAILVCLLLIGSVRRQDPGTELRASVLVLLVFSAGFLAALVSNPNLSWSWHPQQARDWLGPSLLAAAVVELLGLLHRLLPILLRPLLGGFLAWRLAAPLQEYFGWSQGGFLLLIALCALGSAAAVLLLGTAQRRLPTPALLLLMLLQGSALALLLVGAHFAVAAEAVGTACTTIGILLALTWWRPTAAPLMLLPGPWIAVLLVMALDGHWYADLPWRGIALVAFAPLVAWLPLPPWGPRRQALLVAGYALLLLVPAVWLDGPRG